MEKVKPVVELELYLVRHGQSKGNVNAFTPEDADALHNYITVVEYR
jgi:hypothetical protein